MVRCPACGNENPPEYPPEEYPFCIECGAQLGTFRPPPAQRDPYQGPYGQPPHDPYAGRPSGGLDPYGRPPADSYDGGMAGHPDPYARPPADPYAQAYGGGPDPYAAPPETPAMPVEPHAAKLVLESGLGKIEYPLDAPVVTIGRSRSNDINLEDARVSRHHARVIRDERGYAIEDLNSRNGTQVDERAVRDSVPLVDGSIVRIGDSVFRFTVASPSPPPARPGSSPFGDARGGPSPAPAVPEVFLAPWSPVQCPTCHGLKTMRPIVYGPAAQTPGARMAAQRGEVTIGEGPPRPEAPNAECRACGTRVRIVSTGA